MNQQKSDNAKKILKFAVAFGAIAAGLIYLIAVGLGKSVVPYMTASEFKSAGNPTERVRLTGYVAEDSVERSEDGLSVRFALGDTKDAKESVPIYYRGGIPDTFKGGAEVMVEGGWEENYFNAGLLLAKCPSRYVSDKSALSDKSAPTEGEEHPADIPRE